MAGRPCCEARPEDGPRRAPACLHCSDGAAVQGVEVGLQADGGRGGDEVGVREEGQLAQRAAREPLAPRRERVQHHRVSRRLPGGRWAVGGGGGRRAAGGGRWAVAVVLATAAVLAATCEPVGATLSPWRSSKEGGGCGSGHPGLCLSLAGRRG